MFKNYLKIAVRNLFRHKVYSLINISGLAVGIASSILIYLYVHNEMTYDTFHRNADQIYRVYRIEKSPGGGEAYSATTPNPLPRTLRNDYPDLAHVVSFFGTEFPVTSNGKTFKERGLCTDPTVFEMFTFPFLRGNPETALENVNSIVITEDLAEKFFGDTDPIGKTLTIFGKYDFIITGVLKRIPENSSIKFGMLISEKILKYIMPDFGKYWYSSGNYTYVQFSEKFTPTELENQLPFIIEKYVPDWLKDRMALGLQPLTSIHLDSRMVGEMVPPNSAVYLYILLAIAFSVLLIACINFMNLSTARYTERSKEVGMRKVLGAQRIQLIKQFLGESILLSFLALIMGIALAELFLPEFNALAGKKLALNYHENVLSLFGLLGFGLFVGIFSGFYPALFLSVHKPIDVLKGQRKVGSGNINFRRVLVISQFSISILLIICELVITQQLRYMKNHELGFNPENVVVIPINTRELTDPLRKIEAYVNAIHARKESMGILSTAISENVPGYYFQNTFGIIPENWEGQGSLEMVVTSIDEKFLETYQMQLVEGRNFSREFSTDKNDAVLLNETAVKIMGWDTALGKHFKYVHGDGPFTVIGVVKDIHFKSLQNAIEPLIYRFATEKYQMGFLSVRIRPENITEALEFLKEQWQYIVSDVPFEYFFLTDKFAQSYQEEEKVVEIIGISSLLAILLACLGLLGLVALIVTQRTKEIGIRKVLGASVTNIVLLVSKQFVKLVLLANIIAWPIAYFVMKDWLQDYPYRINVGVGFFLLGGVLALLIALLAVSFQAIKAALANPVDALRYE